MPGRDFDRFPEAVATDEVPEIFGFFAFQSAPEQTGEWLTNDQADGSFVMALQKPLDSGLNALLDLTKRFAVWRVDRVGRIGRTSVNSGLKALDLFDPAAFPEALVLISEPFQDFTRDLKV